MEATQEALPLDADLTLTKVKMQNPTTDPAFLEHGLDSPRKAG
jgi:hypothetical protein